MASSFHTPNPKAGVTKCGALVLSAALGLTLLQGAALPAAAESLAVGSNLDVVDFGDAASEAAHAFVSDRSDISGPQLGDTARVAKPHSPAQIKTGELRFNVKVDPLAQNYLTVKFWGSDPSGLKTIAYINGEQIGYRRSGDYEALNIGTGMPAAGRFEYNTIMLPLNMTQGESEVEITLRSYDGGFSKAVTTDSRAYYKAYTHTAPQVDLTGEQQGSTAKATVAPALTDEQKQAQINGYTAGQVKLFNDYSAKVDKDANGRLSIVRYQDELRFYAQAINQSWSPAQTPEQKKAALQRVFKSVDNHTRDYYGNIRLLGSGGHQSDWGGYYGALGEALYVVENLIADNGILGQEAFREYLAQPFVTNTVDGQFSLAGTDWSGGELSRGEAWERVLKANFDFSRSRLSYIYNQIMYTYEGAWEASEGLRVIGSSFYEGKERSNKILLESLGAQPFLGEEVLLGPDGRDLDLYHSLFYHDQSVRYTEDYLQVVMKGHAKSKLKDDGSVVRRLPLGEHFTGITEAGLTRENGYVGNYGEAANYMPEHFFRTLGHAGDEALNDAILKLAVKNLHARGYTRYADTDDQGNRILRMEQVTDERNASYRGVEAYATRVSEGKAMLFASLEKYMADNPGKYEGSEWQETWTYAAEAVGFAQQQLIDNQFFNNFGSIKNKVDYRLADTYRYVTETRAQNPRFGKTAAGVVHPQTDFNQYSTEELARLDVRPEDYEQFAWVDVDNNYVSLRDGNVRIFGALNERNRGFAGNGRLHVMNGDHDNVVQVATNGEFRSQDYYTRMDSIDVDFMEDQLAADNAAPQALAGEIAPITFQPGVGTVNRDNFEADTPYSGYADLLTSRYGQYFFAFNTTRAEYKNEREYDVELPSGYSGNTVLDLVTGQDLPVNAGKVKVSAKSAVVLKLGTAADPAPKPSHVDFVTALPGNGSVTVSWKPAAGAERYRVSRSTSENGEYSIITDTVTGTHFEDKSADNGGDYFYKVAAVNAAGSGWGSYATKAAVGTPLSGELQHGFRDDILGGATAGKVQILGNKVTVDGGAGAGLGVGDDNRLLERDITESLQFTSKPASGSAHISAKLDSASGPATGLMIRDQLLADTRYIYFGADASGNLVLQNRTRDSKHDWQDQLRSPLNAGITGYTAAKTPYLKLVRHFQTHNVDAFASADGAAWEKVGTLFTPFPETVHAGLATTGKASFQHVQVKELNDDAISVSGSRTADQVTLSWNKPDHAVGFEVFRTDNAETAKADPLASPEGWTPVAQLDATVTKDQLRTGTVFYKVAGTRPDGTRWSSERATVLSAEPLADVLARARAVDKAAYTQGSYYQYSTELSRVESAAAEPDSDLAVLVDRLYDAAALLVSVNTLLHEIEIQKPWAKASTPSWDKQGDGFFNAWRMFDGDVTTFTDTTAKVSWLDINPGDGRMLAVDALRVHPRATLAARATGTKFQGSNDGGITWETFYTLPALKDNAWFEVSLPQGVAYKQLRILDDHDGRLNLAEVDFKQWTTDTTLISALQVQVEGLDPAAYTTGSWTTVQEAMAGAKAVAANSASTQAQLDAAGQAVLEALKALEPVVRAIYGLR